jgi:hypothetical protein
MDANICPARENSLEELDPIDILPRNFAAIFFDISYQTLCDFVEINASHPRPRPSKHLHIKAN